MSFIDFGALKERVSIEQVIAILGIDTSSVTVPNCAALAPSTAELGFANSS